MTSLQRDIYSDRPKHNIVIKFSLCVIDVLLMISPQRSICLSIRDSKMESVAAKVLYWATLNPFLYYSARYGNNRFFFPYKSLYFEGYETVPTLIFID